ncbi:DUF503 domain-containing protein [Pajaroellobacter abortibovis]|nr:DUF503 domain-containing protein [Pajaroellobacter abortibovis]
MVVGVLKIVFHIPHARTLKEKRRVIQRFRDRTLNQFDVSIAEVDKQDHIQCAVFGICVVSSVASVCDSILEQVTTAATLQEEAILIERKTERLFFGGDFFE